MSAKTTIDRHPASAGAWLRIALGVVTLVFIAVLPGTSEAREPDSEPRATRVEAELANACVESGQPKHVCVCEVRLLRDALDPHDYRASALLQTAAYKDDSSLSAARLTLTRRGVSEPEVKALETQRRRIVRERLEPTCRNPREAGRSEADAPA